MAKHEHEDKRVGVFPGVISDLDGVLGSAGELPYLTGMPQIAGYLLNRTAEYERSGEGQWTNLACRPREALSLESLISPVYLYLPE